MATEQEQVRELFNKEAQGRAPTLEEFQVGGDYPGSLADFAREHNSLQAQGVEHGLLPPDPPLGTRGNVITQVRAPVLDSGVLAPTRNVTRAFNEVFTNMQISGDSTRVREKLDEAKQRTVQDELVDTLIDAYQDDEFTQKRLQTLHELPKEEQLSILNYEIERRDAHKISAKEALLIHVMRAGHEDLTVPQFDKVKRSFNPVELDQFRMQLREQQVTELRQEVDKVVAAVDIGTTGEAIGQLLQQDFLPISNVVTRMIASNLALDQVDGEAGWFRSLFPGEVRQEIREAFANATPEERIEYVRDIGDALQELADGEYAPYFTEYGILENYMEIFTEELLQDNVPKSTLDRVLGNLDVVLELAFGVGVLAKAGGRTIKQSFRTTNIVAARRAARAAGNHKLRAKLDGELQLVMREAGGDPAEAALVHLPKPPSLVNDREILPDALKEQVDRADRIRSNILVNSDDLTGIALTLDEKTNTVFRELSEIDSHDQMVVHPQMGVLEALPNDTGFKYTAVYGQTPSTGWSKINEALDEALTLDPNLEGIKVMRRNANGELEEVTDLPAHVRGVDVEEGYALSELSDEELVQLSAQVGRDSEAFATLEQEAMRRADTDRGFVGDALKHYDGEEYFLQMEHNHFWHTADKEALGPSTFRNTGWVPRALLPPSWKFGNEIFASFDKAYRIEQGTIRRFEQIYKPYYDLSPKDKEFVSGAMEWIEQYAKENGKVPDIATIYSRYDGITDKQLGGILSLNQGLNVQWEMFNRRLYREWSNKGYKTAKPAHDDNLPTLHGDVLEREALGRGRTVYDPINQRQVRLSADELNDLYDEGGAIVKLDMAMDVPNETGKASTLVIANADDYRVGKLDTSVLTYHPGYYSRFYEDPFFVIKRTGKSVDGKDPDLVEDAIRTAGSVEEAERFIRRFATFNPKRGLWINNEDPAKTYRIQRAAELDQTESSLFSKQSLHREGRLFWDKRNFDRLPDVNGNRADLEDPVRALDRSTVMATRQTTHEDLMKAAKKSFELEFKDILPETFASDTISETIKKLAKQRKSVAEPALKARYESAIEFAKYLRLQQGTDELFVPLMREQAVRVAGWVSRLAGRAPSKMINSAGFKMSRVLENYAQNMDPLRTMRSAAFKMFMVFRPVRQLFLQSAQISFLTALDPLYIGSGKVFRDGGLLRSSLMSLTTSGYDDGLSLAKRAKLMGMSQKQLRRLAEEFDRSGLVDTVDVHAFAGGAKRPRKIKGQGLGVARGFQATSDFFQRIGFDVGEQMNLSMTYMVALRRMMREKGIQDLLKLDKQMWDEVATNAQQLALGMTKPNKMFYQSGVLGNMTQFLSFSHKALLTVFAQNPYITKRQAVRMGLATYALFGANMFGAGDWAKQKLNSMGLDKWADRHIEGTGTTLVDLIAGGLIQTGLNTIFSATMEEYKDIDFGFAAPGANVIMLWEDFLMGFVEAPWGAAFGPFGNIAQGGVEGADFILRLRAAEHMAIEDKIVQGSDMMLRGIMPAYNDVMTALMAYQDGVWRSRSGKVISVEPVLNTIIARGLAGVRSEEELAWYQLNQDLWQTKDNMRNVIEGNRDFLIRQLQLYYNGELSKEFLQNQITMLAAWAEAWPEHLRQEILTQSMILKNQDGVSPLTIMAENAKFVTPDIIALLREFEDLPEAVLQELEAFLREVYEDRVEAGNQTLNEEIQESDLWPN